MRVTKHGERRIRERIGVPKRAVERMAGKALSDGHKHSDFSGAMRRYLNSVFLDHKNANNMRVYNQHLFIFDGETLVTVWLLPAKFRNAAINASR